MSKKPYDLPKLENELKGASAFFKSPAALTETPEAQDTHPSDIKISSLAREEDQLMTPDDWREPARSATPDQHEDTPVTSKRSEVTRRTPVRPVRPVRRLMIRHPFELYQDQVEALRHFAVDDRMRGGTGSMSAMVREAIDRLIDEQSKSSD